MQEEQEFVGSPDWLVDAQLSTRTTLGGDLSGHDRAVNDEPGV